MNKLKAGPKRVVLLVDNTRGHFHQSQGIARWLERLCGAEIHEIRVPILTGVKRFLVLKMQGRSLDSASPEEAREWLKKAGFSRVQVIYTESSRTGYRLPLLNASNTANLAEFNNGINLLSDLIFGSQDYAVIATK